jgi:hypothetical protein
VSQRERGIHTRTVELCPLRKVTSVQGYVLYLQLNCSPATKTKRNMNLAIIFTTCGPKSRSKMSASQPKKISDERELSATNHIMQDVTEMSRRSVGCTIKSEKPDSSN